MDTTDMTLVLMLLANSRISYAKLAENLHFSVNAVHKRIQLLLETGVIKKFTAKVSLGAVKAIVVYISGVSRLPSLQEVPEKLKKQGSVYWLAIGGGKYLYIGAYLKTINDLPTLLEFVKTNAGVMEPTAGIMAVPPLASTTKPMEELTDLDLRIIRALKDDARKPVADVAEELKISAKTVRRRLDRMMKHNLIELSIEWYPDKSNDIFTLIDVHLKPDTRLSVAPTIMQKYAPNILFFWVFANLPNTITFAVWTNNMNELQTIRERLEQEDGIASIVPNILYTGYLFETWRDAPLH
ncbi:MAG TPA: winged helix-turn-helix transcriptional regulator [Candidatus Thermoplasmatota archaeon]|nr:winged helix-turn-helix transcriptional regulator [Candidatus Thermoplasmatota archaeon]